MELGIQYIVRDSLSLQHTADELRSLNGNSTNQYRLLLLMSFLYRLDNCIEFLFLCHIYDKKGGMTGTALTEEKEFRDIYAMDVVEIPTNKPVAMVTAPA